MPGQRNAHVSLSGPVSHLRRRIQALDEMLTFRRVSSSVEPLSFIVWRMSEVTDSSMHAAGDPVLGPDIIDEIILESKALEQLARTDPEIVSGPLDATAQLWTSTGRQRAHSNSRMLAEFFRSISADPPDRRGVNPSSGGLFTSTMGSEGYSSWQAYLELFSNSVLYPRPWHSWRLAIRNDASSIAEVASARDWFALCLANPLEQDGLIYPDWHRIASTYSAVHLTLRAIAGLQGFVVSDGEAFVAPAFWDVESTLWLTWCFGQARLEVVRA